MTRPGGREQFGPYLDGNGNFIPAINTEALLRLKGEGLVDEVLGLPFFNIGY